MDTAASIIAIVQLAEKVIKYVNSVKGAKDDRGRLRDQVRACSMILLQLQDAAEDADDGEAWSNTIAALSVPLARLHRALEMAAVKLHQKDDLKEKLKWPFNEKEVQKLIDAIEGEKSLLLLALENNSAKLLHEIHARSKEQETRLTNLSDILETHILSSLDSFQDLRSTMSAIQDSHSSLQKDVHDVHGHQKIQEQGNKRQKLLMWLSTIDHAAQQRDVLSRYQEGTGQWLLEADNFRDWRDGCIRTLFCPGPPGAGKTTITSLVVKDLKAQYREVPSARVAFLYCGFNHRSTQTPETLLSSLLKQLVEAQFASSKSVVEFYDRHTKAASSPTLKNIMDAIGQEIQTASKVFIVIDALDECRTDNGCRMKLLSELFKLQKECNICLLATSRALPDIIRRFERSKSLEIRASPRDIQAYLDENMYRLPSFVGRNEVLKDEIRSNITTAVDGMYAVSP
jgi:Cdc6-like AAA superfamily ATPase